MTTRPGRDAAIDLVLLAGTAAGVLAATPVLPSAARAALLVTVVLLVPGAACARAVGVRDPLTFVVITVGASPAVLLLLSMGSLLLGRLRPHAVLAADLLVAVLLVLAARVRRRS